MDPSNSFSNFNRSSSPAAFARGAADQPPTDPSQNDVGLPPYTPLWAGKWGCCIQNHSFLRRLRQSGSRFGVAAAEDGVAAVTMCVAEDAAQAGGVAPVPVRL